MSAPELKPLTADDIRKAQIEALEMLRNAKLMEVAALEMQLALLGRTYKKSTVLDKVANNR